jgi:lipopolysaccharide export system protein LptA
MKINYQLLALGLALAAAMPANAERADRDKPVNLEADRVTVDDANKVHIYEGNVQLVQGTLVIRTDKLVVNQDEEGFQKGTAYGGAGGLARFRQKREGLDEYVEGEAERIEHDDKTDKTQLFNRAYVKSGQDEVRGQYIVYDGLTEHYLATSGPNGTVAAAAGKAGRVHAVIQPKDKDKDKNAAKAPARGGEPALKASPEIANPRDEE